jgi:anti-sigma B factor antagonist
MEITKIANGEQLTINVNGRLDTTTSVEFEGFLNDNLANVKTLIIDCAQLAYVSSAGLRVLLSAQKKMQKVGAMKLINVCELVMEVFEMTGFVNILDIE